MCHWKDPPVNHVNGEGPKRLLPDGRSELLDGHEVEFFKSSGFQSMHIDLPKKDIRTYTRVSSRRPAWLSAAHGVDCIRQWHHVDAGRERVGLVDRRDHEESIEVEILAGDRHRAGEPRRIAHLVFESDTAAADRRQQVEFGP
jgi:hypothetical protein